ncbi:MAG: PEP-utilizing enzyme [Candidatus Parcubacteria bacterium]|nr:PEP-utilizing enzyme [Candidatus Parcubacteria bacterium]
MYQPFSDPKNIEKMVRRIVVFWEEATLDMTFLRNDQDVHYEINLGMYGESWQYISTNSGDPREVFLMWDQKIDDLYINEFRKIIEADDGYLFRMEKRFLEAYSKFERETDFIFQKKDEFGQATNNELINFFDLFCFYGDKAALAYYIPYDYISSLLGLVRQKILAKNIARNVDGDIRILSLSGIDTVLHSEKKSFWQTLAFIKNNFKNNDNLWQNKAVLDLIFSHWYKFGSLTYVHAAQGNYSYEDYLEKFKRNISLNAEQELNKLNFEFGKNYKIYLETARKYDYDPKLKIQIEWLRKFMQYRNKEAEYTNSYFDHCTNLFKEIAKRLDIKLDELWLLSKAEIKQGLINKFDKNLVEERKKYGFTIKQQGKEILVYTGVKEEDKIKEEFRADDLIKGQVTFSGLVQGRVKIISNPFHQGKYFQEGDILVTAMTTPDFVPLMKKAAAIVTDEGGILSHASIISRELKKPCVIGTKIATKILRDGDEIEVNAREGIVRILTKHLTQHLVKHLAI